MSHLKGCMSSLTAVQSRDLVLRTGLGLKHGYTREQVAQILHVTLKQEGQIERQATAALTSASVDGRCGNPAAAIRTDILRAVSALVGFIRSAPGVSGTSSVVASSGGRHARTQAHHGAAPQVQPVQPPPASRAAIAPSTGGGVAWPLFALLLAAGLVALWFVVSRLRTEPEGAAVARPLGPRLGAGAQAGMQQLRRGGEALAGVIGLAALREGASARRRKRGAAALERRPSHRPDLPPALPPSNGGPAETVPAASPKRNGGLHNAPSQASAAPETAPDAEKPSNPPKTQPPPAPEHSLAEAAATGAAAAAGIEAFELGGAFAEKGDMTEAEAAYRHADEQGHASAASNLGVLLEQRGDLVGAEAAYRRADRRGDATGAFNLGAMLWDRDDPVGAEEAFRRADQRGDAAGAYVIGTLLEARSDFLGAEAAFRRAADRGHPSGASSLGILLENRGELTAAEAAYRRADERGDATGAFKLGAMLEKRKDFRGAEAAYSRASDRGQGYVADLANAALSLLRSDR